MAKFRIVFSPHVKEFSEVVVEYKTVIDSDGDLVLSARNPGKKWVMLVWINKTSGDLKPFGHLSKPDLAGVQFEYVASGSGYYRLKAYPDGKEV